ncbi:MAG: carbohydrate ABC transporter permease [bacterium]|nr:carbohydrate ABC transporter permease [bacterium]MDY4159748.1 carbohydrate ABC transporter permease [Candidatus Onthovivens sp.]
MIKRLDKSELIFKIISYFLLTVFALFCLYPFVYSISCAISGKAAMTSGSIILWPVDPQFNAFLYCFTMSEFWLCYANTLFLTAFGTIISLVVSILGAYALSKKRLPFNRVFNFLLVFTMWFSAGLFATKLNYDSSRDFFNSIGIVDDKWLVVIAMGINAYNIILLRNGFQGVPKEIEEAAIVDGANETQICSKVYIPMSKATIATVGLFYGISRWNGYFWAAQVMKDPTQYPLQVFIRNFLTKNSDSDARETFEGFETNSLFYCMIVSAIIPIIIVYPFIQKYFAAGVNLGGVKE